MGDEARVGNLGWIQRLGVPVGDKELMEGLREKRNTKQWRKFLSCYLGPGSRDSRKDKGFWLSGSFPNAERETHLRWPGLKSPSDTSSEWPESLEARTF